MSEQRAALRYAKAILDLAVDHKSTDAVESDMRNITATLSESKELRNVLSSPVVNGTTKKDALLAIFKGTNEITKGLLNTLTDNKRIGLLGEVALKYIILNQNLKGQGVAYVTTAVALTPALEAKVLEQVAKITTDKVTIENKIDKTIIGGFILRVGDLQYDASVANKLSEIKREFVGQL